MGKKKPATKSTTQHDTKVVTNGHANGHASGRSRTSSASSTTSVQSATPKASNSPTKKGPSPTKMIPPQSVKEQVPIEPESVETQPEPERVNAEPEPAVTIEPVIAPVSVPESPVATQVESTPQQDVFKVVVVGGGLVGALAAVRLAKRGWQVHIYELREGNLLDRDDLWRDVRKQRQNQGRSINLALSVRGIHALSESGVADDILKTLIPMKGRMIHTLDGKLESQPYGVFGECINSVDRQLINDHLLNEAERLPNVKLFFNHRLLQCDFDKGLLTFCHNPTNTTVHAEADFIIGADGAHSRVRQQLLRNTRMNFSQEYIDHGWLELTIPPTADGQYAIDPHHLHIWPRHTFMMIALPNTDKSFTVTLFMPLPKYDSIQNKEDLIEFFKNTFPDALPVIGEDFLVQEYFKNPRGSLISVKCKPYHYKHRAVIVGDAAHAMVPFYGQGMNCGFEDVSVLNEILDRYSQDKGLVTPEAMEKALQEYTETRYRDAHAMCDLAMGNYTEMRSSVLKMGYRLRKTVESTLYRFMYPLLDVIPLYTMVSFSRIPYSKALEKHEKQGKWLTWMAKWTGATLGVGVGATLFYVALKRMGVKEVKWVVQEGVKIIQ